MTVENKSELSVMKHKLERLKKKLHEKEMQEQKLRADSEIAGLGELLTLTVLS